VKFRRRQILFIAIIIYYFNFYLLLLLNIILIFLFNTQLVNEFKSDKLLNPITDPPNQNFTSIPACACIHLRMLLNILEENV
jgi:hypothetical protein